MKQTCEPDMSACSDTFIDKVGIALSRAGVVALAQANREHAGYVGSVSEMSDVDLLLWATDAEGRFDGEKVFEIGFPLHPSDPNMVTMNDLRVGRIAEMLNQYDDPSLEYLLTDVLHFAARIGDDVSSAMAHAKKQFDYEMQIAEPLPDDLSKDEQVIAAIGAGVERGDYSVLGDALVAECVEV